MPEFNCFRHQNYPTQPALPVQWHTLSLAEAAESDLTDIHARLGLTRVLLLHGTFMGDDPFGVADVLQSAGNNLPLLSGQLQRLADALRERTRPLTAQMTGDVGNYTPEFAARFQELVGPDPVIELLEPAWSSQNSHFARADLAVRLVCWLQELQPAEHERILLWGHSHAGNALALLSNLLANDRESVARFFAAAGSSGGGCWPAARRILAEAPSPHPWARSLLIAAFGTPVRYGWDTRGYRSLVHVLHHRPETQAESDSGQPAIRTRPLYPPHLLTDMLTARYGDWVQAFAIAGTDLVAPRASASQQLGEFLEASLPEPELSLDLQLLASPALRRLCARWKTGTRCHTDGINLLVQYQPSGRLSFGGPVENSLLGHGVATTLTWLPVHLQLVLAALESAESPA